MILKNVSATPIARRHVHTRAGIEVEPIVHKDTSFIGTHEPGQAIQKQSFSGAARAEERRDSRTCLQMDIQFEGGCSGDTWQPF